MPLNESRLTASLLFVAVLFAFVVESQATQYLQTTLGYNQPYFIFYIVHSSFLFSFPLHLIYVLLRTKHGLRPVLAGLRAALTERGSTWGSGRTVSLARFPVTSLLGPMICLTAFYNLPALLWFIAVPLTSVTNVTAIWNANAFFAYIFSVKLLGVKWGSLPLFAVTIATLGVLIVLYGGSPVLSPQVRLLEVDPWSTSAPFIGDMLTLVAAVLYGLYQVLYTIYIALPSDPGLTRTDESGHYSQLPNCNTTADEESPVVLHADVIIYPPPFGLHSNLITATMGLCTLLVFWIPIPLLHYFQIESFRLPPNSYATITIIGIAASGVVFNAGFMILLGIWGPIVTSVGNLLTIVLTFVSDLIFGTVALTSGGLLGAGMILCAFGVLVYDMS